MGNLVKSMARRRGFKGLASLSGIAVIVGVLLIGVGAFAAVQGQQISDQPNTVAVRAVPTILSLDPNTDVLFVGSGFKPDTQISFIIKDENGLMSDVTGLMIPTTVTVNSDGAFDARWQLARFTRVGAPGLYSVRIVDQNLNELATTPVVLCDPKGSYTATDTSPVAVACQSSLIGK